MASMENPARRIFCRDSRQCSPYGLNEHLVHTCALLAHEMLDLAEGLLYGIQVRRVRGQEHKICTPRFDELSYPLWPVRSKPIEDHHLPLFKRRCKEVLHISLEGFGIGGSLYGHGGA